MQFRSRGQIHVDVIHARTWFEQIGISTIGTRLELIQEYFDELLNPTLPDGACDLSRHSFTQSVLCEGPLLLSATTGNARAVMPVGRRRKALRGER